MDIKDKIRFLAQSSGVYFMKDNQERVIYIGKSKNIRNRVAQYFAPSYRPSNKISRMIELIDDIEIRYTDTEFDALLLECRLIKEKQPMYNTLLKNDKKYGYIRINITEEFPSIECVAKREIDDQQLYFGPYPSLRKLERTTDILLEYFRLRTCKSKNLKRCLNYDLGICLGPCRQPNQQSYSVAIQQLIETLNGRDDSIIQWLEMKMEEAALKLEFEKGLKWKEKLEDVRGLLNSAASRAFFHDNKQVLVCITLDEQKKKIYLLRGIEIIYSQLITDDELVEDAVWQLQACLLEESKKEQFLLDKEDLDFANIIYGYVKHSSECEYMKIDQHLSRREIETWIRSVHGMTKAKD